MDYEKGQRVEVNFFGEVWLPGIVSEVYPKYGFSGNQEKKYEVHGSGRTGYITIVSERLMRSPVDAGLFSMCEDAA